ncbi:hypothetical protein JRI60_26950 [Archangium violaceum]|uniref:hypothetical protein n=1 Tax=Archangium violaceum TaxID=83451 RepID=UPI00194FBECD|nr:hypothetical protein [Archangium violaceum]QRN92851.1 hypothetical protein JRI60_26950 [Archangium violaceum]
MHSDPSQYPPRGTRAALELRARQIAERRDAFLSRLSGGVPCTQEERAEWAQLVADRQEVESALERLAVEERIASHQARAQDARAAGLRRMAHHYESEAQYLLERLAEVRHG